MTKLCNQLKDRVVNRAEICVFIIMLIVLAIVGVK